MSSFEYANRCAHAELAAAYAVRALPAADVPAIEDHLVACAHCRRELDALRPVVDAFVYWPTDLLRPPASLERRLAQRIAADKAAQALLPAGRRWSEPEWLQVAPGIACKLFATDAEKKVVSMLVRLAPGAEYPPHTHAGMEELHLLEGELWIDERKLQAGEYNRAMPGTVDRRVWSPGGCTCVLITSIEDHLL